MTLLPIGIEAEAAQKNIPARHRRGRGAGASLPARARDAAEIVAALASQTARAPGQLFDLTEFSEDEKRLLSEAIGEGEVGGVAATPDGVVAQIQEASMAGLWRVRFTECRRQAFRRLSRSLQPAGNRAPRGARQLPAFVVRFGPGRRDERDAAVAGNFRAFGGVERGRPHPHHHFLAAADEPGGHEFLAGRRWARARSN